MFHILYLVMRLLAVNRKKYKQKKTQPDFPTGCASKVLIIFFQQIYRLPIGVYPLGHHQPSVFLRLICSMIVTLNHLYLFLSREITNFH